MRRRIFPALWFYLALLAMATAPGLAAQAARGIFVTPIPNAPFSGTVAVARTIRQADGSVLELTSTREIARDNQGRIHNEFRPLVAASMKMTLPVTVVHLYDPQNRMSAYLYPLQRTYRMTIVNRPPSTDTLDDFASSSAQSLPPSQFTKQEDLGHRSIAGLQAHGVRVTQTLSAEASGTGSEVVVTDEYWYSEDLRINLEVAHSDSRTGNFSARVTEIRRTEPDAGLFSIPADYQMADMQGAARAPATPANQ